MNSKRIGLKESTIHEPISKDEEDRIYRSIARRLAVRVNAATEELI